MSFIAARNLHKLLAEAYSAYMSAKQINKNAREIYLKIGISRFIGTGWDNKTELSGGLEPQYFSYILHNIGSAHTYD